MRGPTHSFTPEGLTHRLRRSLAVGRQDGTVDVGRHSDLCVTEHLAHHLQFHALSQHQARGRVTKLVGVPVPESRPITDLVEHEYLGEQVLECAPVAVA